MSHYHQHGRFYEAEFPTEDDLVVVQIGKFDEKAGAYVTLLEYGNKEAMINLGEISKRRVRSMAKLLRQGSLEVCLVVSVDEEKGYVNLSKKRVSAEDCAPKMEQFAKAKAVHGIMQHVASTSDIPIEELCNKVSWPLQKKNPTTGALDAFKKQILGEADIWGELDFSQPGMDLTDKKEALKDQITAVLQRRLVQSAVRLQAKCEVSCSEYEGIDAVKEALQEGFKAGKEDCEVSIKLIAHPMFALNCTSSDKESGVDILENAMQLIEKAIVAKGGTFAIKSKPTFIQKEEDKPAESAESESGESSGEEEGEQDDTMGNFNADFTDLMKKDVEKDED